jgi:hypothetical protein
MLRALRRIALVEVAPQRRLCDRRLHRPLQRQPAGAHLLIRHVRLSGHQEQRDEDDGWETLCRCLAR